MQNPWSPTTRFCPSTIVIESTPDPAMTVLSPAFSVMVSSPLFGCSDDVADCRSSVCRNVTKPSSPKMVFTPPSTVTESAPEPPITKFLPSDNEKVSLATASISSDSIVTVPSSATARRPASPTIAFNPPERLMVSSPAPANTRLTPCPSDRMSTPPVSASRLSAEINWTEESKSAKPLSPKTVLMPSATVMISAPDPPKMT